MNCLGELKMAFENVMENFKKENKESIESLKKNEGKFIRLAKIQIGLLSLLTIMKGLLLFLV